MQQAAPFFSDDEDILMLRRRAADFGLNAQRLRDARLSWGGIGLLTVAMDDPSGYGHITRETVKK